MKKTILLSIPLLLLFVVGSSNCMQQKSNVCKKHKNNSEFMDREVTHEKQFSSTGGISSLGKLFLSLLVCPLILSHHEVNCQNPCANIQDTTAKNTCEIGEMKKEMEALKAIEEQKARLRDARKGDNLPNSFN